MSVDTPEELDKTNEWLTEHENEVIKIDPVPEGQIMVVYSEVDDPNRQIPLVVRRIRV